MVQLNKRLEIRLDQTTFNLLQERSQKAHKSIGELIRLAVKQMYIQKDKKERLLASENLCHLNAPVTDWPQMEKEIEQGYG